jgi:acetylornithine deacetylase/succinyl-diaminopimelate desuccinylase-like protein
MPDVLPEDEVVRICQELIRIDTSNYGDGTGPGERAAAEYAAGLIEEVGMEAEIFESAPGRANVVTRMAGEDPSASALVVHGHLDVVPALKDQWSVDPFGAELKDGLIWGRGAVDMKDMDAMILAVLRNFARTGKKPKRDIIFAFFADEEAGGALGARYAVDKRRSFSRVPRRPFPKWAGSRQPSAGSAPTCSKRRRRASPGCAW